MAATGGQPLKPLGTGASGPLKLIAPEKIKVCADRPQPIAPAGRSKRPSVVHGGSYELADDGGLEIKLSCFDGDAAVLAARRA